MVFIWTDRAPICVQGIWYIPFAFPAYVFTGYPCWTRKPPFLIIKELFWLEALFCNTHLHHSVLRKQRKHFAVRMELESMTLGVVGGARFELARGVLNIHLTLSSVPTVLIRQPPIWFVEAIYFAKQADILTYWTNAPVIYLFIHSLI